MTERSEELRKWLETGADAVRRERQRLDAINVFPVADSDTGTNLYLTLREGSRAVAALPPNASQREVVAAFARGCLFGARGNSGVIISQYLAAFLRGVAAEGGLESADGPTIAAALEIAAEAAYEAVGEPVEGTVLTVARAAARGAASAVAAGAGREAVAVAAVVEARAELARTSEILAAAREAGVVDAGAAGLLLQLEALAETIAGPEALASIDVVEWETRQRVEGLTPAAAAAAHEHGHGGGAYEVMFVARSPRVGPNGEGRSLTRALMELGDSVAVTGSEGLWQAHVHTDAPDAAVGVARAVASTQIVVRDVAGPPRDVPTTGLVALTTCPGLAAALASAGAAVLVSLDPGDASASDLDRVVSDSHGQRVIIAAATDELRRLALEYAAATSDLDIVVLGGAGEPHIVAALVAAMLASPGEDPVSVMEEAQRRCHASGATVAGLAEHVLAFVPDEAEVATIIVGAGLPASVADDAVSALEARGNGIDVAVFVGGQAEPAVIVGYETSDPR